MTKFFIIALFLVIAVKPATAAAPLTLESEVNYAFEHSENIYRAQVISYREEWVAGDKVITKDEMLKIMKSFDDFNNQHIKLFGLADLSDEAIAHQLEFEATAEGRLFKSLERTKIFATIHLTKLLKGKKTETRVVTCAWTTSDFDSDSHVGVDTSKGSKVTIFLKKGWTKQVVLNPELFLIGSALLTPTTKH